MFCINHTSYDVYELAVELDAGFLELLTEPTNFFRPE